MNVRAKKLVGTMVTVIFLFFYSLFAMLLAERLLPGTNGFVQLVFYMVAGLVWVVPVAALISWMHRT